MTLSPHPPCLPPTPSPRAEWEVGALRAETAQTPRFQVHPQRVARQEPQSLNLFPIRVAQSTQTSRVREGRGGADFYAILGGLWVRQGETPEVECSKSGSSLPPESFFARVTSQKPFLFHRARGVLL